MVPGNHDVDWNTALRALEPVQNGAIPCDLRGELYAEDSLWRWDWKTRTLYRIVDLQLYERRLSAFWKFFENFYKDVPAPLTMKNRFDVRLFSLFDDRIGVAAYNSCHRNDCFAFHGMIRQGSIARSDLDLNDSGKAYDLRMAVWHHSIGGSPYRTDYMDVDVVRGMIGRSFRLGLHGHQHKAQVTSQEIRLPDQERMAVVSAGSLCADADHLPIGTHRQYNILEISGDFSNVRTHVRAMAVSNLFSPARLTEFGGASYFDLSWTRPRNAVGEIIDMQSARRRAIIDNAEQAVKSGDWARVVAILKSLDVFPLGSYERHLFLNAAEKSQNWQRIVEVSNPPTTIEELIQRFNAHCRLGDFASAIDVLDHYSKQLQLPSSLESELRGRASAQEAFAG